MTDPNTQNYKDGFTKAEQVYFFDDSKTQYRVIGSIDSDIIEFLIEFIQSIPVEHIIAITDNL